MGVRLYVKADDRTVERLAEVPAGTMARMRAVEWVLKLWSPTTEDIQRLESEIPGYKEFREHEVSMSKDWHDEGQTLWLFKNNVLVLENSVYDLCFGKLNSWDYDVIEYLNLDTLGGQVTENSLKAQLLMNHDVDIHSLNIDPSAIEAVYWG